MIVPLKVDAHELSLLIHIRRPYAALPSLGDAFGAGVALEVLVCPSVIGSRQPRFENRFVQRHAVGECDVGENAAERVARPVRFEEQYRRSVKRDRLGEGMRLIGERLRLTPGTSGKRRVHAPQPHLRLRAIIQRIGMIDLNRVGADDGRNVRLQSVIGGQVVMPRRQQQAETIEGDQHRKPYRGSDPPLRATKPANA